ncbi:alpha/beta hydrolase [Roseospira goensis]|uniref:Phospholipase/carboxylesterase n=1 Tax=Roseospira goensis TaxID=391922 RepID=A0A7W6S286_9PROT|nr:dienelactone hydrolase family protein [Roseospira goensis]MBB4287065.1 phospholipase/carboxylesterase [Roseospira goensis]
MTDSAPQSLDGPTLAPAAGGPPRRLVVLLHGYGADGSDLIALAPHLAPVLPDAAFFAPHAPEPCEVMPVGRQWFSFTAYDPDLWRRDAANLTAALDVMAAGARGAAPVLNAYLDGLLATHDLGPESLALVGFSQGTMMALDVALRRSAPVAAVIGFSGALTGAASLAAEITARPPVTLVHGEDDPVVPFPALGHAEAALRAANVPVTAHARPGLGHGVDPEGLEIAAAALRAAWPGADA